MISFIRFINFFLISSFFLIPFTGVLANNDASYFTLEEQQLLHMTPAELLNIELSPQSVREYWEKHGVTTASKRGEDPFDTSSAIYIISNEDIQRSGVTTIPEALRLAPGVHVARIDNNKWALSIRGFMRQFASNLFVAIDGVPIHTPVFSGVWWDTQDIVLKDVDRIEVIRGPGSTVWGQNAVSGIINIITKHSKDTQGNYVSVITGNEEKGTVEARYGGKIDDGMTYRVSIKRAERDGAQAIDGSSFYNVSQHSQSAIRVDKQISLEDRWTLNANVFDNTTQDMFPFIPSLEFPFVERIDGRKESQGGSIVSKWERSHQDAKTVLQSYVSYDRYKITPLLKVRGYSFDVDIQQDRYLDVHGNHEFSWGAEYRYYQDDYDDMFPIVDYVPDNRKDHFFSFFAQDRYGIIPNELYAVVGSKVEHNSYTGIEVQPTFRLSWYPDDKQTLWGAISRPVRTPTRAERGIVLLQNKGTSHGYVASRGESSFDSEHYLTYELGYRIRPKSGLLFDATAFYNVYSDIRTFSAIEPSYEDFAVLVEANNHGDAQAYGFEFVAEWQVMPQLRFEGNYSLFYIDYNNVNGQLFEYDQGAPKNQFSLRSYYDITPTLHWNLVVYYTDNLPEQNIDASFRWDSNIQWYATDNITLSLVGQNLFDDQRQEYNTVLYSVPTEIERSIYAKLSWEF